MCVACPSAWLQFVLLAHISALSYYLLLSAVRQPEHMHTILGVCLWLYVYVFAKVAEELYCLGAECSEARHVRFAR